MTVDNRPQAGLRISPHFYNTEEEIDRAVAEISSILYREWNGTARWPRPNASYSGISAPL